MGSVVIVVVHEDFVGLGALGICFPVGGVGPFFVEDAVEAFDFAVGLGPIRSGAFMAGSGPSLAGWWWVWWW